jgi:hypothetical protein
MRRRHLFWLTIPIVLLAVLLLGWSFIKRAPLVSTAKLPPQRLSRFPYALLDEVLRQYVNERGLVNYTALAQDRGVLDRYVAYLDLYSPENTPAMFPSRPEQLAYYLNAYNALVLYNVLEHPLLTDISEQKFDFFYRTTFMIGDEIYNLYELENHLIRPRYQDPRVHFALNCASIGCPKLPQEAFVPERLEEQLDRETKEFLSEARNIKLQDETLLLSQIFEFYTEDFTSFERAQGASGTAHELLLSYVNRYLSANQRLSPPHVTVEFFPYDWTLNKQ